MPAGELELMLWLESDRMGYLRDGITQDKLDNQRQVVMNERRQGRENAPYGISSERLVQSLFAPEHPYYGVIMGSMKDLQAATLGDVHAFFDAYYAPANATLVIAGDFDPTHARDLVAKYFGSLPAREAPKPHTVATAPLREPRRETLQDDVRLPRIALAWLSPAAYHPGDAEADVLASILAGGTSSRLYRRLVYDLALAQDVDAGQDGQMLTGMFEVVVTARPGVDVARLERAVLAELAHLREAPPTEQEVARARNQAKTHLVRALQRLGGFGGRADMLNHYNQYVHDPGFFAQDLARYDHVTPQAVQQLAHTLLDPMACSTVITVPKP
jgi:zinc protease